MNRIDSKEFMDELFFCLKQEDIVKAKALLQFASDSNIDITVQQQALLALGQAPEAIAFPLLEYLLKIDISNPDLNEALYELILDKSYGNTDLVLKYIHQDHRKSRLVFLQAAGDLMLTDAAPELAKILQLETDKEILITAVKALGALRIPQYLPTIASVMADPDMEIKQTAIYAMAEMGEEKAVDQLFKVITGHDESDLLAIEALAGIQNQHALNGLAKLLDSSHTHIRDAAIDQLIEIGKKAVPTLTTATRNAEADYMIHLVTTLGYIGDQSALPTLLDIINVRPKDPNIRQALYEALERLPSTKSAISLANGLQDEVEAVRMSAARAVDKNLSKVLVAGLKNIVRLKDEGAKGAVAALIDAEADNIFNFLLSEESFVTLARDHVVTKADPSTRAHFLDLLRSKNQEELARSMEDAVPAAAKPVQRKRPVEIYVVDDSKMMLKLYQNKLIKLGYSPRMFDSPEKALMAVSVFKPDLIITDLNMPKINGLQLTQEVRKKYTRQQLPIIMITTQSDFIQMDENDHHASVNESYLSQSGINQVLHKPFTDEDLEATIGRFL
ncbi:MAG: response regulator [Desulfobacteraceae bacterium]|nr:response regulator [Desulfobacteraceae bacterium]